MKKYRTKVILLILIIVFSVSCRFEPSDPDYSEVDRNAAEPKITLNLSDTRDTIVVSKTMIINYEASIGDKNLNYVMITIDTNVAAIKKEILGSFKIDPGYGFAIYGIHKLTFSVFTNSKTGSVADKLGMEGFLYKIEKIIVCMDVLAAIPIITNSFPENGSFKITWEVPSKKFIKNFEISRSDNYKGKIFLGNTENSDQTYFYDDSYIGQTANYYVSAITGFGIKIECSQPFQIVNSTPEVRISKNSSNYSLEVEWDKCQYPNAFSCYHLVINNNDDVQIENINECKFSIPNPVFAKNYIFKLISISKVMDKTYNDPDNYFSQTTYIRTGEPIPRLGKLTGSNKNTIFYLNLDALYKYDPLNNVITDSIKNIDNIQRNVSLSPNCRYFLATYQHKSNYSITDIENSKTAISQNLKSILQENAIILKVAISDNMIGAFVSDNNNLFVYDFVNKALLAKISIKSNISGLLISPDGNYIIIKGNKNILYEIDNDKNVIQSKWWDGTDYINAEILSFLPNDPAKILVNNLYDYTIADLSEMKIFNTFTLPYTYSNINNIDFGYNRMLFFNNNMLQAYDSNTGEQITGKIPYGSLANYFDLYIHNNYIYWSQGFRLKLQ